MGQRGDCVGYVEGAVWSTEPWVVEGKEAYVKVRGLSEDERGLGKVT